VIPYGTSRSSVVLITKSYSPFTFKGLQISHQQTTTCMHIAHPDVFSNAMSA